MARASLSTCEYFVSGGANVREAKSIGFSEQLLVHRKKHHRRESVSSFHHSELAGEKNPTFL